MCGSGFIREIQANKESLNDIFERIAKVTQKVHAMPDEKFPSVAYVQNIGCSGIEHFKRSGCLQFNELMQRFRVDDDWTILDMGCGCGRMAFPFSEYLSEKGKYIGFDVWSDGIEWCNENIRKDFQFKCLHAANNYYYEDESSAEKNDFSLGFIKEQTVDLVFAISVFTHLKKEDAKIYLAEISKLLKTKRCAYITCFIIDDFFFEYQSRTGRFKEVLEEEPGCYYGYQRQDFFAGFSLEKLKGWIADAGFELVFHELGRWAEKPGSKAFQDLLIIRKK